METPGQLSEEPLPDKQVVLSLPEGGSPQLMGKVPHRMETFQWLQWRPRFLLWVLNPSENLLGLSHYLFSNTFISLMFTFFLVAKPRQKVLDLFEPWILFIYFCKNVLVTAEKCKCLIFLQWRKQTKEHGNLWGKVWIPTFSSLFKIELTRWFFHPFQSELWFLHFTFIFCKS